MREDGQSIDLPKTALAWRQGLTAELECALEDELADSIFSFLDASCQSGGWPDNEQLEIERIDTDANALTAYMTVYFNELVASGCPELPHPHDREARLIVTLVSGDTRACVEFAENDSSIWDIADRNSAADGT